MYRARQDPGEVGRAGVAVEGTAGAGGRPDFVVTAAITGGPALTSPLDSGWPLIEHMFIG